MPIKHNTMAGARTQTGPQAWRSSLHLPHFHSATIVPQPAAGTGNKACWPKANDHWSMYFNWNTYVPMLVYLFHSVQGISWWMQEFQKSGIAPTLNRPNFGWGIKPTCRAIPGYMLAKRMNADFLIMLSTGSCEAEHNGNRFKLTRYAHKIQYCIAS